MSYFRKVIVPVTFIFVTAIVFGTVTSPKVKAQVDNKAIVQKFADAYNAAIKSGDLTKVQALFSPDYTDPNTPLGMSGWDYFQQTFTQVKTLFPDGQMTIKDMVAENDKVAVFSLLTGTNTVGTPCLSATGKSVSVKRMDIFTLKDGKIVSDQNVSDSGALYQQLRFTITPPQAAATPVATTALPDVESGCAGQ